MPVVTTGTALLLTLTALRGYEVNPPPAHTGGFAEPTCHTCHFDSPVNQGPVELRLTAPATYRAGGSNTLNISLTGADIGRGGFQLAARFASGDSAGRQAGVLRPTSDRVALTEKDGVSYAHHSAKGSRPGPDGLMSWSITWDAPPAALDPIVMHVAANAANDDASQFGDYIVTDSAVVSAQAAEPGAASMAMATGTRAELRGISVAGSSVIWATGRDGAYARSTDGGASWTAGTLPGAEELFLIDVHAVDASTAYALGTHFDGGLGVIYKTEDGGSSWIEQYRMQAAGAFFDGFAFWDAQRGVAFSDPVDGAFLIVTTDDGGASWKRVPPEDIPVALSGEAGFAASGTAITVHGDRDVWFGTGGAGVARVFHSGDGGRTWSVSETPLPAGPTAGVFGIAFRDEEHGVAVGGDHRRPNAATSNIARTEDGGRTWALVGSSAPAGVRYGIASTRVADNTVLLAVGPSGWGYSIDNALSWESIDATSFNTVAIGSDGRAWVAGLNGRISQLPLADLAGARRSAPLDTLLDVGGHRLHFVVHRGTVPLTLVLEAGGGASLNDWSDFDTVLAHRTGATVVAYDRAGLGGSELGPAELTPTDQIHHLAGALERLGTPRRRIVLGHSYGGLLAVVHGDAYPHDVIGLVLIDPMNPRFVEATGDFLSTTAPPIEEPRNDADRAVARMVRTFDGLVEQARSVESRISVPIVVVTAGERWWGRPDINDAWRASHEAMVSGWPQRRLVVAEGSDHDIPGERPDAVLTAVLSLLGDQVPAESVRQPR